MVTTLKMNASSKPKWIKKIDMTEWKELYTKNYANDCVKELTSEKQLRLFYEIKQLYLK